MKRKTLTSHFNFSTGTLEERRRLQKTIYILQAGGIKLGYGFSWYTSPESTRPITDCREIQNSKKYNPSNQLGWTLDRPTWRKIREIQKDFIDPADTPRKLELLTSFHMFYHTWHKDEKLFPYELKQKFREKKKTTFDNKSPITDEQLTEAMIQSANIIAYRNYHENN